MPKKLTPFQLEHETCEEYLSRMESKYISRISKIGIEKINKDDAPGRAINLKANIALLNKIRPDKLDRPNEIPYNTRVQVNVIQFIGSDNTTQLSAKKLPAPVSSSDGQRDQAGSTCVAPAKWEG